MSEQDLEDNQKKSLTNDSDLLDTFSRQIREMAFELQFGNLVIDFKIRGGEIKEAHRISESVKLRPF